MQIIIPVYNEAKNIIKTLNEINKKVTTPYDILVVYDFDEDNTIPAVNDYIRMNHFENIFFVKNKFGQGVIGALKTGFISAKHEAILVVMADFSDDFSIVDKMVALLNEGFDIVCASRYMKGGKQLGGLVLKKMISRIAGVSLYYLTGLPTHDVTNSFKLYRKSLVDNIKLESTGGFEIGMEIVVKAFLQGARITELPSVWIDRTEGKSRFKLFKWLPKYLFWYWIAVKGKYLSRSRK